MNTMIFFALYGISNYAGNTLLYSIDVQVFSGKLVKFIHKSLSSFPGFSPTFMSVYIYCDFEYHRTAVSQVSKSHSCISVQVDLFRCPAGDRKSPPLNIFGKEVDSGEKSIPQTAYLSSEVNKYTAKLSFGSYITQHFITKGSLSTFTEICIKLFTRRILSAEIGDVPFRLA